MTPLESAFTAWLAFHTTLGIDMQEHLLPAASPIELERIEKELGYSLPADLKELYLIANGQRDIVYYDINSSSASTPTDSAWAPLFGYYRFLSLEEAIGEYRRSLEYYEQEIDYFEKYNKANPDDPIEPIVHDIRGDDPVNPLGWNPMWFPFAAMHAGYYYVDLAPPEGGTIGQIIMSDADEVELQVPASSITEFMREATARLDPAERNRYERSEGTSISSAPTLFFNMDWRVKPYAYSAGAPWRPLAKLTYWLFDAQAKQDEQMQAYHQWLKQQPASSVTQSLDIDELVFWTQYSLVNRFELSLPMRIVERVARFTRTTRDRIGHILSGESKTDTNKSKINASSAYLMSLASALLRADEPSSVSSTQAINLYHRYLVDTGSWDLHTQKTVALFSDRIIDVKRQEASLLPEENTDDASSRFYSMESDGRTLSICFNHFDVDTYKSEDICYDVEMP